MFGEKAERIRLTPISSPAAAKRWWKTSRRKRSVAFAGRGAERGTMRDRD